MKNASGAKNKSSTKKPKAIQKFCEYRGEEFIAFSENAKYCPAHRDNRNRGGECRRRRIPNKELYEFVRKVDKYNKENNCYLSYGQIENINFLEKQRKKLKKRGNK